MPPKNQKKKDISDPTMPDKEVKTPAKRGRKKKEPVLNNDGNEAQELPGPGPAPAPTKPNKKQKLQEPITALLIKRKM